MAEKHTLYAIPHSLYSGRARCYLIKNDIPFRELSTGHESFRAEVLPRGKLPTIPTLLTAQGEVIRDGGAIIEHFEAAGGRPCQPRSPRQQAISALFDAIGCEGLLRPAMHYRWNFPDDNLAFLHYHFLHSQRDTPQREAKTAHMMGRMQQAAVAFGATRESAALVETLYLELLAALDAHLETVPYLLGWRPCLGDFGLIGPLYAHLGRDPKPLRLMQQRAVRVYRWVERMNRQDQDAPEYLNAGEGFLEDDHIPDTLLAVLRVIAEDFIPETRAAAACINQWLAENRPEPGTRAERMLGMADFPVRGQNFCAAAQPYRFYLLQKVQAIVTGLDPGGQQQVRALLSACDMAELLSLTLDRQLGRADNLEVWL